MEGTINADGRSFSEKNCSRGKVSTRRRGRALIKDRDARAVDDGVMHGFASANVGPCTKCR